MKLHEYQAKRILAERGVPVPKGSLARTPDEAERAARDLGGSVVLKAQVHAGGRGRAGGVRLVDSPEEARAAAQAMLGSQLVTAQTGPGGVPVRAVLVEETIDVERELYVGMVIDGAALGTVVMASEAGGVDIEEIAERTPERILRAPVDPMLGILPYQGRTLAYGLNLPGNLVRQAGALLERLYAVFEEHDCSLAEINPLVVTKDGRLLAVDAKLDVDDDSLFRHAGRRGACGTSSKRTRSKWRRANTTSTTSSWRAAIGCIVNGAGLAMATMDVIAAAGASPANFLDIGGGADEEKTAASLSLVLKDPSVSHCVRQHIRWHPPVRRGRPRIRSHFASANRTPCALWWCACSAPTRRRGRRSTGQFRPRRYTRRRPEPGRRGDQGDRLLEPSPDPSQIETRSETVNEHSRKPR